MDNKHLFKILLFREIVEGLCMPCMQTSLVQSLVSIGSLLHHAPNITKYSTKHCYLGP